MSHRISRYLGSSASKKAHSIPASIKRLLDRRDVLRIVEFAKRERRRRDIDDGHRDTGGEEPQLFEAFQCLQFTHGVAAYRSSASRR